MKDSETTFSSLDQLKSEVIERAKRLDGLRSSSLILKTAGEHSLTIDIMYTTENIGNVAEICPLYQNKKVIFIVSTIFNDTRFYEQTLDSIWNQEDSGCPVLYLVKDASTSRECFDLIDTYASKNKPISPEFTCLYSHKLDTGMYEGLSQSFDFINSLELHEKSLITYINGDDVLMSYSNKIALSACHQNNIDWITGCPRVIDESNRIVFNSSLVFSSSDILNHLNDGRSGPFIQQEGTYWTLALYNKVRGLDASLKFAGDYDLWQQFAELSTIYTLTEPTASFRIRSGQKSENVDAYYQELDRKQCDYKNPFPSNIVEKNHNKPRIGYSVNFSFPHFIDKLVNIGNSLSPQFEYYSDPNFCYVQPLSSFKNTEKRLAIFPLIDGDKESIQPGASSHNINSSVDDYYWYKQITGGELHRISYLFDNTTDANFLLSFRVIAIGCTKGSSISIAINNITRFIPLNIDHPGSSINKYFEIDLLYFATSSSSPSIDVRLENVQYCLISLNNFAYNVPSSFNDYGYLDNRFLGWPYLSGHLRPSYSQEYLDTLPTISVVIPTFNQGNTIRDTLSSLYAQHYPKLQVIVLDGHSNDSTRDVLKDFLCFISEVRSWSDSGQSAAIAEGINLAKGEIVTWLNTDDLYAPLSLFKVANAYINESQPDIIAGNCFVFRDADFKWIHSCQIWNDQISPNEILDVKNNWLRGKYFHQPEIFFTRSAINKVENMCNEDFINKDLYYSMDYDIWAKMAIASCKITRINSVTAMYRITEEQKTSAVDNYLPELLAHSYSLANRYKVDLPIVDNMTAQSITEWNQFKVLMFNDVGFFGGAGIAHKRIAISLGLYNVDVKCISVSDVWSDDKYPIDLHSLDALLTEIQPNLIICGNLHGIKDNHLNILELLSSFCPCWFVVHDFWITNGHSPYPSLDWKNPLADSVSPNGSWIQQINSIGNLYLLPNSKYCREVIDCCGFSRVIDSDFHLSLHSMKVESECSQFIPISTYHSSEKICIVLGSVGLYEERKGIAVFLDALKLMPSSILSKVCIKTYGFNSLDQISLFCEYEHHGYIDQHQINEILASGQIYINTSKVETFGQTTLEALNFGLICLSNRNGGSSESITNKVNGYNFDMTSKSLSDKLAEIINTFANQESQSLCCEDRISRSLSIVRYSSESQGYSLLKAIVKSGHFNCPVGGQKVTNIFNPDAFLSLKTLL